MQFLILAGILALPASQSTNFNSSLKFLFGTPLPLVIPTATSQVNFGVDTSLLNIFGYAQLTSVGPNHGGPNYGGPNHGGLDLGGPNNVGPNHGGPNYGAPNSGGSNYGAPNSGAPSHVGPNHGAPNSGGPNHGGPNYVGHNHVGPTINNINIECASKAACNQMQPTEVYSKPDLSGLCQLPAYPDHGTYTSNIQSAVPGQVVSYVSLNISCDEGYGVDGDSVVFCQNGKFFTKTGEIPQCVPFCKLDSHISVQYHCQLSGLNKGSRPCRSAEPAGTVVIPECNFPNYFSNDLRYMRCNSAGQWNRIVTCQPECGRVTPSGDSLIINGTTAKRGEVPWHVAIYRKPTQDNKQYDLICGGSLVSNSVVLSAGHCFWASGTTQAASKYSVATAKLFSEWDHPDDKDAQKSELKSIEMSEYFKGASANFQNDIAVLILKTPFVYHTYVRPVCLDFRSDSKHHQLEKGDLGKVAGFGLTGENGPGSQVLKVAELPYVPIKECYDITPATFTENITGDKICAGYTNGSASLCKGDSGGGLCFPETDFRITRFYLRGIVSTAPAGTEKCNPYTVITFTQIKQHEDFINQFL